MPCLRPVPDLLNQHLHFNNIPSRCVCTLRFEKANQLSLFLRFTLLQKQLTIMYSSVQTIVWNSDLFDGLMLLTAPGVLNAAKKT